ncbi:MAG: hypothetical protein J0M01_03645 [Dechloromonas sp.]|jgi:hypothetical protein|nr:hypothetical protein [Dechloromonas sp.]
MDSQEVFDIPALKAQLLAALGPDFRIYPVLVEQQFPHILAKVAALWGKAGLDAYLADLMVTNRPGRQGFPHEVALEIFRLATVHSAFGLTPNDSLGTAWGWVDDPELFKRQFTNKEE